MRVIAGTYKGRRLAAPAGLDVRPTSDRAREALFGVLGRRPAGSFLDLFSGTGAVALEAISRGYAPVWCVENGRRALAALRANARGAALNIMACDARDIKDNAFADVSVIFADPPYDETQEMWAALAGQLRGFLAPGGVLVWECRRGATLPSAAGLALSDERIYGSAKFLFFERQGEPPCTLAAPCPRGADGGG
jgi:16S rRNA (guanine966-N2)-methyltransferase